MEFRQITGTAIMIHEFICEISIFRSRINLTQSRKVTIGDHINDVQVTTLAGKVWVLQLRENRPHFSTSFCPVVLLQSFMLRSLAGIRPALINSFILRRSKHTMRLVQFVESGKQRVGVEIKDGGDVVDVSAGEPSIPSDMKSFLAGGEDMMSKAQRYLLVSFPFYEICLS